MSAPDPFVKMDARGCLRTLHHSNWVAVLDQRTDEVFLRRSLPQAYNYAAALKAAETYHEQYGPNVCLSQPGWTVPAFETLILLPDRSRYPSTPDLRYFDVPSGYHWTRTPAAWSPRGSAWIVYFSGGGSDGDRQGYGYHVLLSRPRQSLELRPAATKRAAARRAR